MDKTEGWNLEVQEPLYHPRPRNLVCESDSVMARRERGQVVEFERWCRVKGTLLSCTFCPFFMQILFPQGISFKIGFLMPGFYLVKPTCPPGPCHPQNKMCS